MGRLILAILALCFSTIAIAAFPKPTDVAPFVQVVPTYSTDGSQNTTLDPSVTPPTVTELTNIPIPSTTNRIVTGGPWVNDTGGYCLTAEFGGPSQCTESKFRTHVDFSHILPDDPIRNFGEPGTSHLHCFFGNGSTNAYSTYASLRRHGLTSTAAGTDANATGYWYPCMVSVNPFGDGKNYVIKANVIIVYYVVHSPTLAVRVAHLPIGLRYIFGYEMDDEYAWLQAYIDAANAASTNHSRYSLTDTNGKRWGQTYYICQGATAVAAGARADQGTSASNYIRLPDGSDPYGGTCSAGQLYYIGVNGNDCWDGKNLWSEGGYKNVIPRIWDKTYSTWVCPTNYYTIPPITLEIAFTQTGWSDRQTWELSSDLAKRASTGGTYATIPPGYTFHTDWMFGWDGDIINKWQHNCIGLENHIPHQCSSSIISSTEYLKGGIVDGEAGAGGRNPQISTTWLPHGKATDEGYIPIPPAWSGSLSGMHIHH